MKNSAKNHRRPVHQFTLQDNERRDLNNIPMTETKQAYIPDEAQEAVSTLVQLLSSDKLQRLAKELQDIIDDTGFGEVNIQVRDSKVLYVTTVRSFK
jgi:hypothetical protein